MLRRVLLLGLTLLAGCGTPVTSQPTRPPVINITPAATQDIAATATALAFVEIPTATPPGLYVVREGDTLESLATAFNTSVDEIAVTNGISDVNSIYVGQPLIIPSLISNTAVLSDVTLPRLDATPTVTPTP